MLRKTLLLMLFLVSPVLAQDDARSEVVESAGCPVRLTLWGGEQGGSYTLNYYSDTLAFGSLNAGDSTTVDVQDWGYISVVVDGTVVYARSTRCDAPQDGGPVLGPEPVIIELSPVVIEQLRAVLTEFMKGNG